MTIFHDGTGLGSNSRPPGSAVRHASVARHVTVCAMLPGPFTIKAFVLSIFKWPLKTGFTVYYMGFLVIILVNAYVALPVFTHIAGTS